MGIIIILAAAVFEVTFGIYCISTKSNQKRIRNWIRVGGFVLFEILALASIIQWSFRWVIFDSVLAIWALIGVISLVRKKQDRKKYSAVRILLKAASMIVIVVITVTPALLFPQYRLPKMSGKYVVKTTTYTYMDKNRIETFNNKGENRELNAEFWYPEAEAGKYPLVVFSHGAFGIKASNTSTYKELASNGYVVCSIDHPYHSLYTKDSKGKIVTADKSFINEIIDVNNGVYDDQTRFKLEQKWMKLRTEDMKFVLDTIIKNAGNNTADKVYQLVDTDRIGLMGHSLGGAAAVQLGRERSDIDAVINLDADLLGEYMGFSNGKPVINTKPYPVPLLSIYSDDMKRGFESVTDPGIVIPQKLISATAPKSYEVFIGGTNHMSLTDLPLFSPFLVNMIRGSIKDKIGTQEADKYYVIEKMNSLILEFFNSQLKGEGEFNSEGNY